MLKLGDTNISKLFLGTTPIAKAYLGSNLVWSATQPLPYDAEVKYLESTGTQWIDTGVYGSYNRGTEIDFAVTSIQSEKGIFGCLGLPRQCSILAGDNFRYDLGSGSTHRYAQTTARRVISYDPSSHVVTDSVYGVVGWDDSPSEFSETPDTMTIFADKRDGAIVSTSRITSMRLYGFKVWDSSGDLLDLIPVRFTNELNQSEGAMYDRVSGQLFRNQGTGKFKFGADADMPYDCEVDYLESNGTQWIDLGIRPDWATTYEFETTIYDTNYNNRTICAALDTSPEFVWFFLAQTFTNKLDLNYGIQGADDSGETCFTDGHTYKVRTLIGNGIQKGWIQDITSGGSERLVTDTNYPAYSGYSFGANLRLFSRTNLDPGGISRMGRTKLSLNGVLLYDLVPCVKDNNEYTFYNVVSGQFADKHGTFSGGYWN